MEFLAAGELLAAELDKLLPYTAPADTGKGCAGVSLCDCLIYGCGCVSVKAAVSAVRG